MKKWKLIEVPPTQEGYYLLLLDDDYGSVIKARYYTERCHPTDSQWYDQGGEIGYLPRVICWAHLPTPPEAS